MKLSIIVPALNEEKTIGQVLDQLAELNFIGWEKEVIVVDDGSTDNSKIKMQSAKSQGKIQNLIFHEKNQGKGAAIRSALEVAIGDAVVIQDADLEYDPAEIQNLLEAYENGAAVFGSRNLHPERTGYPHYVLGVWVLTKLINILYRAHLTDSYTCYKLIPRDVMKSLDLQSRGFEFEAEVCVKLLKKGIKIKEVPIRYSPRRFAEGKKIKARDGLIGLWTIIKNRI